MSASFPAPVSGHFAQPSPMYPNQGFGVYNDPYQQLYNQAPGSSYPAPSHQPGSQQPMMKPSFDPRQANGYVYPQNGAGQMMSPGMGGPYPQQSMRPPQNYYGQQQAMGQMPPASMQKPPASSASSTAMGPPNGMQQNMMIQQGMNHIPTSAAGPAGQIPTQMKSPMSMPIRPQQQQSTQPQMNSPGMFATPAPPRMKQQLPSPGTMHVMPSHPMAGDPSSSTASHMVQQAQNSMNPSTPRSLPAPPTQETPFTAVTHYEMPPAFPQYQDQFKKHNPTTVHYYDRRRSQLKLNYPTGQVQAPAQEPPTFGFLPGQARYEEKFDRRNPASSTVPTTQMNSAPMTSNPMLHRQMSAPGIASPSYAQQQQQMMPAPTGPAAKKTKRSASTTVEPNPPPSYQANRMVHMGTFNNPNLKSPGLMPMNSPMGSMQSPQMPPSSVAGSNGMNMMPGMPPIGANGMNGNGMVPSSIGMDHNGMGSHVGNGMAQSMSNMQQNGQFHDMRPPPQYSQMQMPSSSQVYNNQMQQRYGNGLMSPAHQEPNPSPMQQNGSQPGMPQPQEQISQQHPQQLMYMRQLPPCNTCKAEITQGSPCKICANPSCRRTFHVKCSGLTDAATSLLNQNADIGWVCPVCDPRPR